MGWVLLAIAIVAEVGATLSLKLATSATKTALKVGLYVIVAAGYLLAIFLLSQILTMGIPVGVAYGIWSGVGVALTAILGKLIFKDSFTWVMALGVALIIGGVLLVELGSSGAHA